VRAQKSAISHRTIKLEEEVHVKKVIAIILCLTMLLASSMAIAETSYNQTWNSTCDPATWNGNPWSGNGGGWFVSLGAEGMFQFARLSDNIYPRLATGITHEGNVTTVTLRQGALYSDGVEITAKDIWGWFMLQKQSVTRYLTSVDIVDDYTLDFVFQEPAPYNEMRELLLANSGRNAGCPYHIYGEFIDKAAELWASAPPAKEGVLDYFGKDTTDETFAAAWSENWNALAAFVPPDGYVASGPYVQDGAFTESDVRLKKNDKYWDIANVKFDVITNKNTTPEQGVAMLKSAETDCYPGSLAIDAAEAVLAANDDIVFYPTVDPACHGMYFNQKSVNSPMSDVNFRKAVCYVIDKKPIREIGNYYGQEFAYSCTGMPPLFLDKYISADVLAKFPLYNTDPAKAEELLTGAGYVKEGGFWCYPDGTKIKVVIGVNGGWQPATVVANVCQMVADQLNAFGIYAEVLVVESSMYSERLKNNEFCMCFEWIDVSWSFSDPYFTLKDFFYGGYATHMGIDLDEITGKAVYHDLVDFNGTPTDPIALIDSMPYLENEADRLAIAERLSWIADEYCFGINLYQNVTGIWENRATTAGLPHADQIDEYDGFMPVPSLDDPEFANIVNLNWGFSGYMKLFYLYPRTVD
jgi:peptide/nickel transport system substrate-binding protein